MGRSVSSVERFLARPAIVAAFLLASCALPAPGNPSEVVPATAPSHVDGRGPAPVCVLVALDGVRARDVFEGVDPERWGAGSEEAPRLEHLPQLVNHEGTLGRPKRAFRASGPNFVSLPGYVEMLSGAVATGCTNNECGRTTMPTIVDELAARAGSDRSAAVFASWAPIERASSARRAGVVSTGLSGGHHHEVLREEPALARLLDGGATRAAYGGIRADAATFSLGVGYLRRYRPKFLFLGLGETDEYAHADRYRDYYRALADADRRVGELGRVLDALEAEGHSVLLLVTTDHGRAAHFRDHGERYPESSESFLLTRGASELLPHLRPERLADIPRLVRAKHGIATSR